MSRFQKKIIIMSLLFLCAAVMLNRAWASVQESQGAPWTFPVFQQEHSIDWALEETKPTVCMRDLTEQRIVCLICHHKNGDLRDE